MSIRFLSIVFLTTTMLWLHTQFQKWKSYGLIHTMRAGKFSQSKPKLVSNKKMIIWCVYVIFQRATLTTKKRKQKLGNTVKTHCRMFSEWKMQAVFTRKKIKLKNLASLTGNSLVLPCEMIIWSCWIAHPIELHIVTVSCQNLAMKVPRELRGY